MFGLHIRFVPSKRSRIVTWRLCAKNRGARLYGNRRPTGFVSAYTNMRAYSGLKVVGGNP